MSAAVHRYDFETIERDRVAVAAAVLDQIEPGHWERVDPDWLDLGSPRCCYLGQVYGHYDRGLQRLGITGRGADWEFAFLQSANRQQNRWRHAAWKEAILARRASHRMPSLESEPLDVPQRETVREALTTAMRIGVISLATMAVAILGGLFP